MLRKHPHLWLMAIGVLCAALAGHALRQRQDVADLTASARQLLNAPPSVAPELQDLDVARAGSYLDAAREIIDGRALRGLGHYVLALTELQRERPDEAAAALADAAALLGDTPDVRVLRAAIAMQRGVSAGIDRELAAALSDDPAHLRAHLLAADRALDRGDAAAALRHSEAVVSQDPLAASALNRRGLARELGGAHDAALSDFEAAAGLSNRLPHAHLNLARLQRDNGDVEAALLNFLEATRRAHHDADAWLGAGLCRADLGDPLGARSDLERARDIRPDAPAPLVALADLDLAEGDRDAAITRYRAALTLEPKLTAAWVKLGNALVRDRQPGPAAQAHDRALSLDPKLAAAHNGRGAALSMLGEDRAAEAALTRAAALDAEDPNPLRNLAQLRARRGDAAGAALAEQQALARAALR